MVHTNTSLPAPVTPGGPQLLLGGSSQPAAKRAARLADGFDPTDPRLIDVYRDECARLGRQPGTIPRRQALAQYLYLSEAPDRAWP